MGDLSDHMKQYMQELKGQIEAELERFFEDKIREKSDPFIREMVKDIRDFTLGGGKRLRPILVIVGHDLFAEHSDRIVKASISMEISQTYFLIQDDVMDQSTLRRGNSTFHVRIQKRYLQGVPDGSRIAENISIVAGDIAESYSHEALLASGFSDSTLILANEELSRIFETTGEGQLLDVISPTLESFSQPDLLRLHLWKTANYTVSGPLKLGAILSGNQRYIQELSYYGSLVGIAFQIRDDIIGLFGDEKTVGKSPKSDVNEGKKTLLMMKAMEESDEHQREFIRSCLESGNVSDEDFVKLRRIVESSGSLDYSLNLAGMFVRRAKDYLSAVKGNKKEKDFLLWFADYVVERKF